MLRLPSSPIVGTSTSTVLLAALLGLPYRADATAPGNSDSSSSSPVLDAYRLRRRHAGRTSPLGTASRGE
ncbi:MAG TPA: hypothetical protein VH063_00875 [Gaiellaceae bacterium]|jgi:hypothetical protein|nr:hypothetical protein [Gaiellaceae bacterium]